MTIGLIKNHKNDLDYSKIIKDLGGKVEMIEMEYLMQEKNIKKADKKVDVYFWQSIDRGAYYRRDILDPVYFLEKFSRRKILPGFNEYYFYNDKIKQKQALELMGINQPKFFYTRDEKKARAYIKKVTYPFVLKDPHSASSLGVYLVENTKQANDYIKKIFSSSGLNSLYGQFFAEEFIEGLERSIRIITVDDNVVASYARVTPGDWRHRMSADSSVKKDNIPKKAKDLCKNLAEKFRFKWMSWDLLIKDDKIYIIEFSCNFGTKGAEELGYNPKKEIIKYIMKKYDKKQSGDYIVSPRKRGCETGDRDKAL